MGSYPPQRYVTRGTKLYHNMFQVASSGGGGGSSIGGWKELGRTTLSSHSSNISVSSLPDKRYYMILYDAIAKATGGSDNNFRFNSDSGSNYAHRKEVNGGNDSTGSGQDKIYNGESGGSRHEFGIGHIANKSDRAKLMITQNVLNWTTGASGELNRKQIAGKWVNTSDSIDEVQLYYSSGRAEANSEVVVLGYDESDSQTGGFFEELASVTLDSDASEISSGTISAKKWLWCQVYFKNASTSDDVLLRFNNDSSSNYNHRHALNFGSDTTQTAGSSIKLIDRNSGADVGRYANFFIVNNSDKEKLVIANGVEEETSGANNPPTSSECAGKWCNTSSQITEIDCFTNSGNIRAGAELRVWGSD